jgi:hypothetical protein
MINQKAIIGTEIIARLRCTVGPPSLLPEVGRFLFSPQDGQHYSRGLLALRLSRASRIDAGLGLLRSYRAKQVSSPSLLLERISQPILGHHPLSSLSLSLAPEKQNRPPLLLRAIAPKSY